MASRFSLRRPRTWVLGGALLVLLVAVVAPWVYINFIKGEAPERLTFESADATGGTGTTAGGVDGGGPSSSGTTAAPVGEGIAGTWRVAPGSQAGYRVGEVLFGQDTEAAGRTSGVTGEMTIDGTSIRTATFTVDMTTVTSDESRRDGQFRNRIMDVVNHPTATFDLTEPIALAAVPDDLEQVPVTATGDFTVRGVTRSVTFDLLARRNGPAIEVNGSIPVVFDDLGIPDASGGPATVKDNGEIEFLLVFER